MTWTIIYTLAFGLVYSLYLGSHFRFIDESEYYSIARNIAITFQRSLDGINPTAFHCPGYPFFLSSFLFFGAGIIFLRFLNFVSLAFSIFLIHRILDREEPGIAGTVGALLVVCYPVLYYTAGMLYPQTIAGTILLTIVWLAEGWNSSSLETFGKEIIIGILFGILILFIPVALLILFPFIVWVWWVRKRFRSIAIITAIPFLLVGLWILRNYLVFKSFVFINSNSGVVLLLGNSEHTRPNAGTNVDIGKYVAEANRLNLDEIGRDRFFRQKALEFMVHHKRRTVELYLLKFLNYFHYRNELGTKSEAARWKDVVMLLTWGPLLGLFLVRLLLAKRLRITQFEGLLILLYFSSAAVHAIFYPRIRYRLPFDLLLIMVVALYLAMVMERNNEDWDYRHQRDTSTLRRI